MSEPWKRCRQKAKTKNAKVNEPPQCWMQHVSLSLSSVGAMCEGHCQQRLCGGDECWGGGMKKKEKKEKKKR